MLDIFKKDPPLSYIFTPYKPIVNLTPNNDEIADHKIVQDNLNDKVAMDLQVDLDENKN